MSFHVGQRVVFVDATPEPGCVGPLEITPGQVYVVRWAGLYRDATSGPASCIRLHGVKRKFLFDRWADLPFLASRFRPLITRSTETGMAILRKVADDAAKRKNLVSL